ncbi:proteasome assembly chaperone 2 [Pelomyxa schiedti]|nr:proteasome assembly chaperone 2 [Pelomyxa schiedti]
MLVPDFFVAAHGSSSGFSGCPIIVPALTIGNVPQMACDLLIHNSHANRVGYICSDDVVATCGVDAYTPPSSGVVHTSVELYECPRPTGSVFILQQRSPVRQGCGLQYAASLSKWLKDSGFSHVVLLVSIDAGRVPPQEGSLRFFVNNLESALSTLSPMGQKVTESDLLMLSEDSPSLALWKFSKESALPFVVLETVCHEGDNVVDAVQFTCQVNDYLHLLPVTENPRITVPPSWSHTVLWGSVGHTTTLY